MPPFLDSDVCRLSLCPLYISYICLVQRCCYCWTQWRTESSVKLNLNFSMHKPITRYDGSGITGKCKKKQRTGSPGTLSICLDAFPKGNKSQTNKKIWMCALCFSMYVGKKRYPHLSPKSCFVPLGNGKRVSCKSKGHALTHWADPWASNLIQGVG